MYGKTCGHNCHLLRSGVECSPCKFKTQNTNTMNPIVERLKEIIAEKDRIILEKENDMQFFERQNTKMLIQIDQMSDAPINAINDALLFLNVEIPKARQRNKQVLKDLKNMLKYESTERTS